MISHLFYSFSHPLSFSFSLNNVEHVHHKFLCTRKVQNNYCEMNIKSQTLISAEYNDRFFIYMLHNDKYNRENMTNGTIYNFICDRIISNE